MTENPILSSTSEAKIINFNWDVIEDLKSNRWREFSCYLKEAFKIERDQTGTPKKILVSDDVLHCLDECLKLALKKLQESEGVLEIITEILRALRNCISNVTSQKSVEKHTNILITCNDIFSKVTEIDQNTLCLKILLQFLINLISSNKETTENVYNIFFDKIKICLKENIHLYETSALIYYISLSIPVNNVEVIDALFEKYENSNDHNEFICFFLEHSISNDYFWSEYNNFKMKNRIVTLEVLRHIQLNKTSYNLPLNGLDILINKFLTSIDIVFQINEEKENDMRIYEVPLILEIISSLSSDEYYLQKLQNNKELFVNAGMLLINVHRLGKVSDNCFTPVQRLSEFRDKSDLQDHPAFGFKADLIRLIGNLCWKNTEIQDLARTADIIPVILDCCNMDARNPFIIQWAILAVRNLCENNLENQKLIAGLHQEGAVSSEVLSELGMTLHSDRESDLKIVSLDSLRNNLTRNS